MTIKRSLNTGRLAAAVFALAAGLTARADYPSTVLSHSPLGYWRFNETASSPPLNSVANSGTVGSAANGYAVLDAIKGQPGIIGNSIRFNNPGGAAGYCGSKVEVPFNPGINPNAPFSVEFWAKPNDTGADSGGISDCALSCFNQNWFGGANRSGWLFYMNHAGVWQFRLGLTSGYAAICPASSGNAAVGVWQHLAATFDGTTVRLYVNGNLVGSIAAAAGWAPNSQSSLRIGGTPLHGDLGDAPSPVFNATGQGHSGNRGFDGWVDEVAVYPSLLSQATIKAHFDAATTNNAGYHAQIVAAGPVGYWGMDEAAVTAPDPSTFPIVANSGSLGTAADGTNMWGSLTAQAGSGYAGFGAGDKACFFDGANGYVALPDAAGLHFSGNITLMAWVKPAVQDYFRDILTHGWDDTHAETFLRLSRGVGGTGAGDGNYYELGVTDNSTYYDSALFPIPPNDIGNWVFLAGTYDGANWNLYRNGVLAATVPSGHGALDVTNRWSIGSRAGPSPTTPNGYSPETGFAIEGMYFGGSIDEPAIFNTALSAADISALYNAALASPVISRAVANPGTVFKGSSASFSVWAEGSPTLTYLWTSNGVSTGVTTTNYTASNLAIGTPTIAVIVSNPYGSATSSVTFTVIAAPPSFTQQPVATTRYSGRPFSFSVVVAGSSPMSLQWKTNGVAIPGATSATYSSIASPSVAFNYSCTASNEAGQLDSSVVALTVLPVPGGYAGAVLADTPLAYWRLDEASGTIAHDAYNGNDGTYFLSTLNQAGYSEIDADKAVAFSGTNSHVGNISGTAVNFQGHVNFSVEAWVNAAAGQSDQASIIAKGNGDNGTTASEQFALDVVGGKYRFFTRGNAGALFEADASSGPDGTWQHLVGVYDDTGATIHIYVNGEEQGTGGTRASGLRVSSVPVSIGSKRTGNDPNYDGTINGTVDEVAVYNYALSPAKVLAHYGAAYGAGLPPIIARQPASVTNYISLPATLSVGAYGTLPLSYQWKKGGVEIADATKSTLDFPALAFSDAGTYSVTITNVNGVTNSASASVTVLAAPTSPPAIIGLVLHLAFDGDLNDSSGHANHGAGRNTTLTSTTPTSPASSAGGNPDFYYNTAGAPDSVLGQSLHYHTVTTNGGNSAVTNSFYVTLGVKPDFNFGSNINFSVAYWVRFPANIFLGDLPILASALNSYGGAGFTFAPSYDLGGWSFSLNGAVQLYGPDHSIDDGEWHHLVHTFNRTGLAITYLDGKQVDSRSAIAAGNLDTGNAISIGQDPSGAYPEEGSYDVDDIGVWRKVLTPLEAASIFVAAGNNLSFAGAPITLTIERIGTSVKLTWPAGTLQAADNVAGPYVNVTPTSPLTVPASAAMKFYRVKL